VTRRRLALEKGKWAKRQLGRGVQTQLVSLKDKR
jgi:hypothetical protein